MFLSYRMMTFLRRSTYAYGVNWKWKVMSNEWIVTGNNVILATFRVLCHYQRGEIKISIKDFEQNKCLPDCKAKLPNAVMKKMS